MRTPIPKKKDSAPKEPVLDMSKPYQEIFYAEAAGKEKYVQDYHSFDAAGKYLGETPSKPKG